MRIREGAVSIGQTGTMDGIDAGTKQRAAVRQRLGRFARYRVSISPDGRVSVYRGSSTTPVLSHRFASNRRPSVVTGGVALGAFRARTAFDDVSVWPETASAP